MAKIFFKFNFMFINTNYLTLFNIFFFFLIFFLIKYFYKFKKLFKNNYSKKQIHKVDNLFFKKLNKINFNIDKLNNNGKGVKPCFGKNKYFYSTNKKNNKLNYVLNVFKFVLNSNFNKIIIKAYYNGCSVSELFNSILIVTNNEFLLNFLKPKELVFLEKKLDIYIKIIIKQFELDIQSKLYEYIKVHNKDLKFEDMFILTKFIDLYEETKILNEIYCKNYNELTDEYKLYIQILSNKKIEINEIVDLIDINKFVIFTQISLDRLNKSCELYLLDEQYKLKEAKLDNLIKLQNQNKLNDIFKLFSQSETKMSSWLDFYDFYKKQSDVSSQFEFNRLPEFNNYNRQFEFNKLPELNNYNLFVEPIEQFKINDQSKINDQFKSTNQVDFINKNEFNTQTDFYWYFTSREQLESIRLSLLADLGQLEKKIELKQIELKQIEQIEQIEQIKLNILNKKTKLNILDWINNLSDLNYLNNEIDQNEFNDTNDEFNDINE